MESVMGALSHFGQFAVYPLGVALIIDTFHTEQVFA